MIYNIEQKYLHIAIPRTGSTQINILLNNLNHPEPDLHHMTLEMALVEHPQAAGDDFFRFTFVRHPLDRLVSLYFEFTKNRGKQYSGKVKVADPLFSEFNIGDDITSFRNFAVSFPETDWINNIFLRPQYQFVESECCSMNFIGKFEHFENDWLEISKRLLGKTITMESRRQETHRELKPRSSQHKPYMEYYDQKTIDCVKQFYSKDFEMFDYE